VKGRPVVPDPDVCEHGQSMFCTDCFIDDTAPEEFAGDPELSLVTTDHEGQESAGEGVAVGSVRVEPVVSADAPNSPPAGTAGGAAATASPAPFTTEEFDAIVGAIWSDLDDDPTRIGDLLAEALGFIGSLALRHVIGGPLMPWLSVQLRAAELLRAMEQRALWGPDNEQEDHR
jgi:hypothetical protein